MVRIKNAFAKFYLALIILFLYIPILVLIVLSFNSSRSRVVWEGFTFEWYVKLFSNQQILDALQTTLVLGLVSAAIATIIGVLAALGIQNMRKNGYSVVMSITNIPILNADIVTGIAMMLWFVKFLPLGFTSVLIAHITFGIPYVILSVMPKLRGMNVHIYEAARDLGAGSVYAFFKIVLPQIASGVVAGFFMALTMSMDDFVITYFTKGAGVNTLSTMIYGEIRKGIKPEMYALSTIIFAVILVILIIVNKMSANSEAEHMKDNVERVR
ncbi:MAG: ABC transporter permease [Lachnospiraceae bacterium]|nr:ABC transporter permease [Lachnospiraceae bacterium]